MKYLLVALLLISCTEVSQVADTKVLYKRDVRILHGGREFIGIAVLPLAASYKLELTFPGEVDLFTFRSCHREVTQEDAGGGGIFGKKNRVAYTYDPVGPFETDRYCPIEISGLEQQGGRHSFAFIDFETSRETMPAVVTCNGKVKQYSGVSVCQSPAGLMQRIKFARKVSVTSLDGCPVPLSENGSAYDLLLGVGRCVYSFRSSETPQDFHRLSTIGYQEILIRKLN